MSERSPADLDASPGIEKVERCAPGEPLVLEIGFHAITLRRIDFDVEDETFAEWIRAAFQELIGIEDVNDWVGRPECYTPTHDTPDEDLVDRVSFADAGEALAVQVEFPAGVLAVAAETGLGDPFAEGVRRAVRIRLARIDRREVSRPTVTVEVSPETAVRARLKAEYWVMQNPDMMYPDAFRDALSELVAVQTEYVLEGGDVISSVEGGAENETETEEGGE